MASALSFCSQNDPCLCGYIAKSFFLLICIQGWKGSHDMQWGFWSPKEQQQVKEVRSLWLFKTCVFLGYIDVAWFKFGIVFIVLVAILPQKVVDCVSKGSKFSSSGVSLHVTKTVSMCDPNACFLSKYAVVTEQKQKGS